MSTAIDKLISALQRAVETRPKIGGFPHFAEVLRQAGVRKNTWALPACQSIYLTEHGPVAMQGTPLVPGTVNIAPLDREALIRAIRADQAGKSTFPEFLLETWNAGVVRYEVDFIKHTVTYYGCNGELYLEQYPAVEVKN